METHEFVTAIDTIWVLLAAALVFFMQAGFAMVETGFTRSKNAGNIIMKNLMDFSIGSLTYWIVGFSIMFGISSNGFIGNMNLLSTGSFEHLGLTVPKEAFLIFQTVFCATAATIVSGAMAERTKFNAYLIYSFFISLIIYPVVGHWTWGGGWLDGLGFMDFAGSTVVHSVGGWSALMGAWIIGPRIGKYTKDGKAIAIPGHSLTLGALGVFILWLGWFGFNPGSTLSGMASNDIAHIFVTTNLAAAAGAFITMVITWLRYGKPDVSMTLNGALAGLVGITAGTDVVSAVGSVAIGLIAGVTVVFGIEFIDRVLKVDDPVGAIGVHGICGAVGTVSVGLFAVDGGLFYGGGLQLLFVQVLGVFAVALWTLATSFIVFKTIDSTIGLRVPEEEEVKGLDIEEHGIESYADFQVKGISMTN
ncbi:ammonium transporter (TC 1.A.11) [Natronincola peptidivorans]|uniref:Ammonium transporter n=1 Tax=Natronincola peptidivorans TaxID=426128 RepID=A0A1I0C958_9FIRM|nr:ammonium transporter [Natronincola peptidivorans]SET15989.1 ammonium transporter (TC 1.A.11) [Natronincola peptidivorans]